MAPTFSWSFFVHPGTTKCPTKLDQFWWSSYWKTQQQQQQTIPLQHTSFGHSCLHLPIFNASYFIWSAVKALKLKQNVFQTHQCSSLSSNALCWFLRCCFFVAVYPKAWLSIPHATPASQAVFFPWLSCPLLLNWKEQLQGCCSPQHAQKINVLPN